MKKSTAWNPASVRPRAWRLAEEAADRAGVSLEEWLDEAIIGHAAEEAPNEAGEEVPSSVHARPDHRFLHETKDSLESVFDRFERRLRSGEDRLVHAYETLANVLDRNSRDIDRTGSASTPQRSAADGERQASVALRAASARDDHSQSSREDPAARRGWNEGLEEIARRIEAARQEAKAPNASPTIDLKRLQPDLEAAVSRIALHRQELDAREALRASAGTRSAPPVVVGAYSQVESSHSVGDAGRSSARVDDVDDQAGELEHACAEADRRLCAIDLGAMREGIAAMHRSLAELAPRNAVVALEGAVRDLTERVALLRREGELESLRAPLDAMAADLRATLKSYDPQAAVAGLEREISALAGRVEALTEGAVNPESFDRIQRQTEEVFNLLTAAAARSAPLERLERQIGELAGRIEGLGASQSPQVEYAQMTASLADLRKEIERSTPLSMLPLIERRLEHIAARLDEEISVPAQSGREPHALADLAHRIDDVRQSLDVALQAQVKISTLEASLKAVTANLENSSFAPLAALMRDLSQKLDSVVGKDEPMFAEIIDRLDRLPRSDYIATLCAIERLLQLLDAKLDFDARPALDRESVSQIAEEVERRLEQDFRLRTDAQGREEQTAYVRERLEALSGLEAMQGLMRRLSAQLTSLTGELATTNDKENPSLAARTNSTVSSGLAVHGIEAVDSSDSGGRRPLRLATPANEDDSAAPPAAGEEVLLEPGAEAPHRAGGAREATGEIGSKTNASISVHIAAARRAAHSALSERGALNATAPAPAVAGGMERVRSLYTNHKRSVLLATAFTVVAITAVRLIGVHAPVGQKSDLVGRPSKTATLGGSRDRSGGSVAATPSARPKVDVTPTASIAPLPGAPSANSSGGASWPKLSTSVSAALPTSLRDAVVAGSPSAQYELAQRLFEGRGVPQDQQSAALWFERAASSGLAPAQFRLATLYSKGVGVQRDTAAAKRWYSKAAEAGNARAAHNLAVMYAEPVGETPDFVEAAKWFRKAAELGVRDSQFNLAILCARGLGVDQDFQQSWLWFSLAAAQGDGDAARKRDEIAAKMTPHALAAAAEDLAKFRIARLDPVANEVPAPPGGWDEKSGTPSLTQTPSAPLGDLSPIGTP